MKPHEYSILMQMHSNQRFWLQFPVRLGSMLVLETSYRALAERLNLAEARVHVEHFDVKPEDIDEQDHVNNSVYMRYADRTAILHANRVGMGVEVRRALGLSPVVWRHSVTYRKSAVLGDALEDQTWIDSIHGFRAVRRHEIRRANDQALMAEIHSEWVWVDAVTNRPKRVPSAVLEAFGFLA
jgi:acyl-CoA thioester hydrolase